MSDNDLIALLLICGTAILLTVLILFGWEPVLWMIGIAVLLLLMS